MTVIRIGRSNMKSLVLFLGLLLVIAIVANGKEHSTSIPTFSFADLQRLSASAGRSGSKFSDRNRKDDFLKALSTNGLLAVRLDEDDHDFVSDYDDSDGYSRDRRVALDGLCSCVDHPGFKQLDQTHELTLMGSSTSRSSVATATVGLDHPLPLPKGMEETCGIEVLDAMEGLRDSVATVSRAFVSALDRVVVGKSNSNDEDNNNNNNHRHELLRDEFGKSYETITDIIKAANHLEHFHVYTNNNNQAEDSENDNNDGLAWDWHTDAGLFLVFVPAWDCNHNGSDGNHVDDSFYYRDNHGDTVRAKFDGGRTAIVMLGQGAQDWLDLPSPKQPPQNPLLKLKATTHSVRWSEPAVFSPEQQSLDLPKQRRAWYGMMNLVPETALVYGGKSLREVKQSLSLAHQHKTDYQPPSQLELAQSVSLGCGGVAASPFEEPDNEGLIIEIQDGRRQRQRHLAMQDASMCNNVTNFFCWMTCMDIPKLDQAELFLEADYNLYCVDRSILESSGNIEKAYEGCINVHNMGCKGHWERGVEGIPPATINITASSSEIELPFCYSGTTMYMEGFQWIQSSTCVIILFPSWVLNSAWKYFGAVVGTIFLAIGLEKFIQQRRKIMASMECGNTRLVASATFYGVQLTIGYMLMLIIMVYSGILFLSVILGLVIGHVLFNARDAVWPIHESPHLNDDDDTNDDDEDSKNSHSSSHHGIETAPPKKPKKASCCAITPNILLTTETGEGEERALREGSTHCQEFESENFEPEYYGSLENGSNHNNEKQIPAVAVAASGKSKSKSPKRKKVIDQGVPEGSTPCCQHGV